MYGIDVVVLYDYLKSQRFKIIGLGNFFFIPFRKKYFQKTFTLAFEANSDAASLKCIFFRILDLCCATGNLFPSCCYYEANVGVTRRFFGLKVAESG